MSNEEAVAVSGIQYLRISEELADDGGGHTHTYNPYFEQEEEEQEECSRRLLRLFMIMTKCLSSYMSCSERASITLSWCLLARRESSFGISSDSAPDSTALIKLTTEKDLRDKYVPVGFGRQKPRVTNTYAAGQSEQSMRAGHGNHIGAELRTSETETDAVNVNINDAGDIATSSSKPDQSVGAATVNTAKPNDNDKGSEQ